MRFIIARNGTGLSELDINELVIFCNQLSNKIDKLEIYYNQSLIELKLPDDVKQLNCDFSTFDIRNKN